MRASTLIRETRHRHALSQQALARRAGTSQAYVSRIETGEVGPSVSALATLLAAMGESLELQAVPLRGNRPEEELREDYRRLSPERRIEQAAELSFALTSIANAPRRPAR